MSGFRRVLGFVTKNQQDNDEKPVISAPVLTQSTKDLSSTQKPQPVPPQQQQQQQQKQQQQQPVPSQSDSLLQSQRIPQFQQTSTKNDQYTTPPTSNRNSQLNPDSPLPAIPGSAQTFNSPKTSIGVSTISIESSPKQPLKQTATIATDSSPKRYIESQLHHLIQPPTVSTTPKITTILQHPGTYSQTHSEYSRSEFSMDSPGKLHQPNFNTPGQRASIYSNYSGVIQNVDIDTVKYIVDGEERSAPLAQNTYSESPSTSPSGFKTINDKESSPGVKTISGNSSFKRNSQSTPTPSHHTTSQPGSQVVSLVDSRPSSSHKRNDSGSQKSAAGSANVSSTGSGSGLNTGSGSESHRSQHSRNNSHASSSTGSQTKSSVSDSSIKNQKSTSSGEQGRNSNKGELKFTKIDEEEDLDNESIKEPVALKTIQSKKVIPPTINTEISSPQISRSDQQQQKRYSYHQRKSSADSQLSQYQPQTQSSPPSQPQQQRPVFQRRSSSESQRLHQFQRRASGDSQSFQRQHQRSTSGDSQKYNLLLTPSKAEQRKSRDETIVSHPSIKLPQRSPRRPLSMPVEIEGMEGSIRAQIPTDSRRSLDLEPFASRQREGSSHMRSYSGSTTSSIDASISGTYNPSRVSSRHSKTASRKSITGKFDSIMKEFEDLKSEIEAEGKEMVGNEEDENNNNEIKNKNVMIKDTKPTEKKIDTSSNSVSGPHSDAVAAAVAAVTAASVITSASGSSNTGDINKRIASTASRSSANTNATITNETPITPTEGTSQPQLQLQKNVISNSNSFSSEGAGSRVTSLSAQDEPHRNMTNEEKLKMTAPSGDFSWLNPPNTSALDEENKSDSYTSNKNLSQRESSRADTEYSFHTANTGSMPSLSDDEENHIQDTPGLSKTRTASTVTDYELPAETEIEISNPLLQDSPVGSASRTASISNSYPNSESVVAAAAAAAAIRSGLNDNDSDYEDLVDEEVEKAFKESPMKKEKSKKKHKRRSNRSSKGSSKSKPFNYDTLAKLLHATDGLVIGQEFNHLDMPSQEKYLIEQIIDSISRLSAGMMCNTNRYEQGCERLQKVVDMLEGFEA